MPSTPSVAKLPAGPVEYRLLGEGDEVVVAFHGAHLSASSNVGLGDFVRAGYRVLTMSRPGYGETPLASGRTRTSFAETVATLCEQLEISTLRGAVGMSHGGPYAMAMAVRYPDLVQRLILESALSSLPWPDPPVRIFAEASLNRFTEGYTWATIQQGLLLNGDKSLRVLLGTLSTRRAAEVLEDLGEDGVKIVRELFMSMRSGSGFLHDMNQPVKAEHELAVQQPTLVISSRDDGQLPFSHAEHLAATIPNSTLVVSPALSHLIWYGKGAAVRRDAVIEHLRRD